MTVQPSTTPKGQGNGLLQQGAADPAMVMALGGVGLTLLGFILVFVIASSDPNLARLAWVILSTGIVGSLLGSHAMVLRR